MDKRIIFSSAFLFLMNVDLSACAFNSPSLPIIIGENPKFNMVQQLDKHGYPYQIHYIETEDHYVLKCYRIQKCPINKGLPLLLMHGLFCNSIDFLIPGEENALGYLAAKECYDTWICNNRGNFESRNNTRMSPKQRKFWLFSWHEMGQYDLPAIFGHIQNTTGQKKLNYIGHSQGTTQFFVYCSLFPRECSETVNHLHAMAPVVIMKHMNQPFLRFLAKNLNLIKAVSETVRLYDFPTRFNSSVKFAEVLCYNYFTLALNPCANFFIILAGDDPAQLNTTIMELALKNNPAGSSFNQSFHYAQLINSGYFHYYDHSFDFDGGNLKYYGQLTPPKYKIEDIATPMTFYYGLNDEIANSTDVLDLSKLVTKANVELYEVKEPNFGHFDFIYGRDVKTLVNDIVLANLEK